MLARIEDFHLPSLKYLKMGAILVPFLGDLRDSGYPSNLEVARLEQFAEDGRQYVRVRLQYRQQPPRAPQSFTFVFSKDNNLAVRSSTIELGDVTGRSEATYDKQEGITALARFDVSATSTNGEQRRESFKVVHRSFGPTPETEFTPERLLSGPIVRRVISSEPPAGEEPTIGDWYRAAFIAGAVCLLGGLAISRWSGRRERNRIREGDGGTPESRREAL